MSYSQSVMSLYIPVKSEKRSKEEILRIVAFNRLYDLSPLDGIHPSEYAIALGQS
jgi:hypothetical protein